MCYTSDLVRASKTAEVILKDYHTDTPVVVDGRIKEQVRSGRQVLGLSLCLSLTNEYLCSLLV